MASSIVNISVCSIPQAFNRNWVEDLRQFLRMKAYSGRWLEDAAMYPQKTLNRMVRREWLILHDGKYYQRKGVDVFPLEDRYTHGKITVACLDDPTIFKAMLFLIGYFYLMSPQAQRERKSRRKRNRPQVNGSKHLGGISLTLCMKFFGFGKTWCHNMRKLCERLGLASWERRWVPVDLGGDGEYPTYVADQLLEGAGRFRITKGNIVVEEVAALFIPKGDVFLHIPYEYRKLTHERYL